MSATKQFHILVSNLYQAVSDV